MVTGPCMAQECTVTPEIAMHQSRGSAAFDEKAPPSEPTGANAGQKESIVIVCGWVNARNSFGGYVGDKPFLVAYIPSTSGAALIGMDSDGVTTEMCLNEGVPLGSR